MHDGVHAVQRALAGVRVAHVADLLVHAQRVEARGDVVLAVQQHVERAYLMAGVQQFVYELGADVAGASSHKYFHVAFPVCGSRSGRNIGRSCSNSISAFS